jgi:hypothetical protein
MNRFVPRTRSTHSDFTVIAYKSTRHACMVTIQFWSEAPQSALTNCRVKVEVRRTDNGFN